MNGSTLVGGSQTARCGVMDRTRSARTHGAGSHKVGAPITNSTLCVTPRNVGRTRVCFDVTATQGRDTDRNDAK